MSSLVDKITRVNRDRRSEFVKISRTNIEVVDELVKEARRLSESDQVEEASKLIAITKKVLNNNKRFQNMVGEVLSSAD